MGETLEIKAVKKKFIQYSTQLGGIKYVLGYSVLVFQKGEIKEQLFSSLCKIFHTLDIDAMRRGMRNVGQAASTVFKG